MTSGYYRFPTVHDEAIVFVSEDDLWRVSSHGGVARRLTSNLGAVTYPMFAPDGERLAFVGREEGAPEIYVMPAQGGEARRLTYQSSDCRLLGWNPAGSHILYASNYGQAHSADYMLYQVAASAANGEAEALPYGPARSIAFGPNGQVILGRNTGDPARWKRYRGGTAGQIWIDENGDGQFVRFLPELAGNIASPMWLDGHAGKPGRIYFISDHEGIGNIYSTRPDGTDLQRHTDHENYYARNPTSDGHQIVYHAGADLWLFDVASETTRPIEVEYYSPRVQRNRKFVYAGRYLDSASLNPKGTAIALTTRGKAFHFYNHEGAVVQHGQRDGIRYRLADWLNDGKRLVLISDEPGEEVLEIHSREPGVAPHQLQDVDIGRAVDLQVSPLADKVALSNHRHELLVVDLEKEEATVVDRSPHRRIAGFDWSPDGRWLVYGYAATHQTTELRLYRLPDPEAEEEALQEGAVHVITQPVLHDVRPVFDPEGRYIYFLSYREFNPVYDGLHFDLGFPRGVRPYLLLLREDLPNPFVPRPAEDAGAGEKDEDGDEEDGEEDEGGADDENGDEDGDEYDDGFDDDYDDDYDDEKRLSRRGQPADGEAHDLQPEREQSSAANGDKDQVEKNERAKKGENGQKKPPILHIDLEGIEQRVLAFPVSEGRYGQIAAIPGKALFTIYPIRGSLHDNWDEEESSGGLLQSYTFKEYKSDTLAEEMSWFDLSRNRKKVLYGTDSRLRVIAAGEKAPSSSNPRKSGWIDLGRVKVSVDPQGEWEQMLGEAWRLQRDQFWTEDMSDVDWQTVYERYFPLIKRVSSRSEFSDLMWEMQGELGTSHAYEFGGDYRSRPIYSQGFLGADLHWDADAGGYRVGELIRGDSWNPDAHSALAAPGVNVRPGSLIVAVNGQPVSQAVSPAQLLVNQAGEEVLLTLKEEGPRQEGEDDAAKSETAAPEPEAAQPAEKTETPGDATEAAEPPRLRTVTVRTLDNETPAHYRAWVEGNRRRVHTATDGRVGYVHIPDMGPRGYAEFHRGYLAEVDKDALIVDVRYNGGGNVSALILEKLARRRLGYDLQRWGTPSPYPTESVGGPLVALTNEHAGSDGDIFSHSFKLMGLGPLVGKRTWGGVVGIWPRHALVDGTVTTQPEFSFWFEDVGWNVENYGVDPDIEVDITPQDYREGRDTQLDRAIQEILALLAANPPLPEPNLSQRPSRALPKLPPRPDQAEAQEPAAP